MNYNTRYRHPDGRILFVADGISNGRSWATYCRKPNGSLKRFTPIKPQATQSMAQYALDDWVMCHNYKGKGRRIEAVPDEEEAPSDVRHD